MTNDEGMTKLEGRRMGADDSFWDDGALEAKELHLIFSKIWRNK